MSAPPDSDPQDRPTLERLVPELLKRVIETGAKNLNTESLRQVLGELKMPKEAIQYTISHLDETRQGVYRSIAKEVRELFDRTSLSDEIAKALSLLTLEVKMEVRFKPSASDGGKTSPLDASVRFKRSESSTTEPPSGQKPAATTTTTRVSGSPSEPAGPSTGRSDPPADSEKRKE
jgi:hypothetical protein